LFFKKKRYSEVEGYDRISRMVEDNQGEGGQGEEDLFEEDTVLLSRESRDSAAGRDAAGTDQTFQESVTVVKAPPVATREPSPTVTPATVPPPAPPPSVPAPLEPPRMPIPDMSLGASQTGASLVAKDAVWEGKLICSGNVRVEGTLRGEIETQGTLFVAAEAQVDGTVRARNVTLAGEIKGDLHCDERLEVLPGGAARGEVDTGALVVHEGAFIDSRFQMRREAAAR
jgi:cytoskeletal protein CcmA (bactofilin family)